MKRIAAVILSVVFATGAFAAEKQRYQVATRGGVGFARIGVMFREIAGTTTPATTASRNVTMYSSVNGFSADLTPDEAKALTRSADVVYVEPAVERHAFGLDAAKETDADKVNPLGQVVPFGVANTGRA